MYVLHGSKRFGGCVWVQLPAWMKNVFNVCMWVHALIHCIPSNFQRLASEYLMLKQCADMMGWGCLTVRLVQQASTRSHSAQLHTVWHALPLNVFILSDFNNVKDGWQDNWPPRTRMSEVPQFSDTESRAPDQRGKHMLHCMPCLFYIVIVVIFQPSGCND